MQPVALLHSNNEEPFRSNHTMKRFCTIVAALAILVSCQKQPSEEEKKAEVEKQVQERLAAEHQKEEEQRLAQPQTSPEVREKAPTEETPTLMTAVEPEPAETETRTAPREREPSETSERRSTASYGTFYRKLEPYGAWRETSDYGYVWQPREAEESRNWRPYTDGHWVYTDAGWTWVSEESFGWATYHYGRWVRLRRVGWVWVPGEEWAPAWVSWRTSKDYVGWAPLPPEARFDRKHGIRNWADNYYDITPDQYAFVPGNEFGSRQVRSSVVPVERNVTIVIETTNVTNITYSNTTIVNEGPNYEEMRSRSRQPIERYRLQRRVEMNADTSKPIVRGEVLEMSAPVITTVEGIDRPQTVKETLAQTTVEKTWAAETDHAASERARVKMKAEVTPPPDAPSKIFVRPASTPAAPSAPAAAASATPSSTPVLAVSSTSTPAAMARPTVTPVSTPAPAASASPPRRPRTTPTPVSTPTPSPSPRPTVTPVSTPILSATVRPAATVISTPTPAAAASPSATARPPLPIRSPRPSPASTAAPAIPKATAASSTPPPVSVPSLTPDRAAQLRQFPRPTPSPRPKADTAPSSNAVKPTPPNLRPTTPVARITPPPPTVAPPPLSDIPVKPPASTVTSPAAASSPTPNNPRSNDRKSPRRGPGERETPTPSPAGSIAPE
jgi:hypothetical protein